METQRTIDNFTRYQQQQTGQNQTTQTDISNMPDLMIFTTIFALNLVQRFPNLRNIDQLDTDCLRKIARLSVVAALIGLEEWTNINTLNESEQLGGQFRKVS